MTYHIEQRDELGNWGQDFIWNQGGNEFVTEADAEQGVEFLTKEFDMDAADFRVVADDADQIADEEGQRWADEHEGNPQGGRWF